MAFDTINDAGTGFLSRRLGKETATGGVRSALSSPAGIESLNRTKRDCARAATVYRSSEFSTSVRWNTSVDPSGENDGS